MENYLLVYRTNYSAMPKATAEQAEAMTKRWMDWIADLNAKNKLTDRGNRLVPSTGKVMRPNNIITNGPYAEIKESIGGYSIIKAESFEEAIELSKSCPMLSIGGTVEIREISNL